MPAFADVPDQSSGTPKASDAVFEDVPVFEDVVMVTDAETGSRIDNATVTITREDGWTKTSCLTTWRRPIAFTFIII